MEKILLYNASCWNREKKNKNNTSGHRNVHWDEKSQRWIVCLQVNGKGTTLGTFSKEQLQEAGKFAEKMRQKYYGEYAGLE